MTEYLTESKHKEVGFVLVYSLGILVCPVSEYLLAGIACLGIVGAYIGHSPGISSNIILLVVGLGCILQSLLPVPASAIHDCLQAGLHDGDQGSEAGFELSMSFRLALSPEHSASIF